MATSAKQQLISGHQCLFHVMNAGEQAPLSFLSAIHDVPRKAVVRLAGGCGEMSPQDVTRLRAYFLEAFAGYQGLLFSGGTAQYNEATGDRDFMITDVPVTIAKHNLGVKVLGSFPRTAIMEFADGQDNLHINKAERVRPDARYNELLAVQENVNTLLGWDGDLNEYFSLMDTWRQAGAKTGVVTFNGGGVTYKEGGRAVSERHPLLVIRGSGRRSEDLAREYQGNHYCHVADLDNAQTLRAGLLKFGLLPG